MGGSGKSSSLNGGDSAAIFCSFSDSVFTIVDSHYTGERNLALNSVLSVCSAAVSGPFAGDLIGGCIGGGRSRRWVHHNRQLGYCT